jgi:hypothetical protein
MALLRLFLKPGVDKQNTEYGAEGGWVDSDYVRFRYGLPEKIGGWTQFGNTQVNFVGSASDIFTWNALDGVTLRGPRNKPQGLCVLRRCVGRHHSHSLHWRTVLLPLPTAAPR